MCVYIYIYILTLKCNERGLMVVESKKLFEHETLRALETYQKAKPHNIEDENCVIACLQLDWN